MQHSSTRATNLIAGTLTCLAAMPLAAQDRSEATRGPWQITAGGGVGLSPEFPGSDSTEVLPLPAFDITYDDRWFLNRDGLGVYLVRDRQWLLSASLGLDIAQRDESDADHLRGTGDVDRTAVAILKAGYTFGWLETIASVATDIADEGHGTVAELALQASSQLTQSLSLEYGIAGRWVNDEYARTFFAVNGTQSARSGLPVYAADGGLGDARVFVNALYVINPRWLVHAGGAVARLEGDAADSPIVEDDSYFTLEAAVMYRF